MRSSFEKKCVLHILQAVGEERVVVRAGDHGFEVPGVLGLLKTVAAIIIFKSSLP